MRQLSLTDKQRNVLWWWAGGALFALIVAGFWGAGLLPLRKEAADEAPVAATPKAPVPLPDNAAPELSLSQQQGIFGNHLFRDAGVAAHWITRSGTQPRIMAAHPGPNAGVRMHFRPSERHVHLVLQGRPQVARAEGLKGTRATFFASERRLHLASLTVGSIRLLRALERGFDWVTTPPQERAHEGSTLVWSRQAASGSETLRAELRVLNGAKVLIADDGTLSLDAGEGKDLQFELSFLTSQPWLTPLPAKALLREGVSVDKRLKTLLRFLAYEEKFLGGSWRFLTYFGRDTLLAARLLQRVLTPKAYEAALAAVLSRLSVEGAVAHEEVVGEWVAFEPEQPGRFAPCLSLPSCDYVMLDDNLMLASVVHAYLREGDATATQQAVWLSTPLANGLTVAAALRRNFGYVLKQAEAYARSPRVKHLLQLRAGHWAGDWRDSRPGLAGGRFPYSVNAVLMPAALRAIVALGSQLHAEKEAEAAARYLPNWARAREHFMLKLPERSWRKRVADYGAHLGVPTDEAMESAAKALQFPALSLDAQGRPLPIMHSDEGFDLLFDRPSPTRLRQILQHMLAPFPAGLWTPIGMVVSNPAPAKQTKYWSWLGRDAYHGAVVWSWNHSLWAEGLRRQLGRVDLPDYILEELAFAERRLWRMLDRTRRLRATELWSWTFDRGRFAIVPFGQGRDHYTESNVAHLLSVSALGLERPSFDPPSKP